MDNFPKSNSRQQSDNFAFQKSEKSFSISSDYQLACAQALIRGYLSRKSIHQDQIRLWAERICDFKAFKAYFNEKLTAKVYDLLEPKGMYFKIQDITPKWFGPITRGYHRIYIGEIDKMKCPHGYGIEIMLYCPDYYSHSGIYEGSWHHGMYHGKGRQITDHKIFYFGDWVKGDKHGKGIALFEPDKYYEGEWQKDRYHGFGHSWNSKGEHWEGQFQSGYPHGLVRNWENTYEYYGYFKEGYKHGNGWIKYSNGHQYIGGFIKNIPNGKGLYKYPNGNYYRGSIEDKKKSGYGIFFDKKFGVYKGNFKNDKAIGNFLLIKNSGEIQKLIAIDGWFIELMNEILKNLYLGSAEAAQDLDELKSKGIRNIVRVLDEEDVPKFPELNYHIIPIKDSKRENISRYFHDAIKFIHAALLSNEKVLVHCYRGVSRSSTIVLAYIMASQKCDLETALKLAKKRRKIVHPNSGFIKQLNSFDFNNIVL